MKTGINNISYSNTTFPKYNKFNANASQLFHSDITTITSPYQNIFIELQWLPVDSGGYS